MEGNQQNQPFLPPNYISLVDLKERWMIKQQQEQERENQQEEEEPQQTNISVQDQIGQDDAKHKPQFQEPMKSSTTSNPYRRSRRPMCRNSGSSKSEIEAADAIGAALDEKRTKQKGKKKKKNQKKQNVGFRGENPAMNGGECGEERESERMIMGDRTAEIGERCRGISASASEWMNNVRSRVAVDGSKGMFRAYRGMGKNMRENGLLWVKKEEVAD